MRNINLLPKIPFATQYFRPLLASIAAAVLLSAALLVYADIRLQSGIAEKKGVQERLSREIGELTQERTVDPLTRDVLRMSAEVQQLKGSLRNWLPVMEVITRNLPNASRIVAMEGGKNDLLALKLDISSVEDTAAYVVLLQSSAAFDRVTVKKLEAIEMKEPDAPSQAGGTSGNAPAPGSPQAPDVTDGMSKEQFLRSLDDQADKGAGDDSSRLLQQLNRIVTKRMAEQIHGIRVPDSTAPPAASPDPPKDSPITERDWEEAQQKLNDFKKMKITDSPVRKQEQANEKELATVRLYRAELELKLRPNSAKEK